MTSPRQISLFDQPTLNISGPVKDAMNDAAKRSGMSRDQIVDRMNKLADGYGINLTNGNERRATIAILEKWLNSKEKQRKVSLEVLEVFCAAVEDMAPLKVMAKPLGGKVIGPEEQELLEWAMRRIRNKVDQRITRRLEAKLEDWILKQEF